MPTYEYKCQVCGHHFEEFQSMLAEPIRLCPRCKGPVIRLPGTGGGIIFKGSGFYETDYKRKKGEPEKPEVEKKPEPEKAKTEKTKKEKTAED